MAKENKPDPETINADWTEPDKMLVSYKGPLSGLLDEIATRFGIWWKYEKGQIYFYKYENRTFVLYSLPTKPSLSVSMGGSSSGESGRIASTEPKACMTRFALSGPMPSIDSRSENDASRLLILWLNEVAKRWHSSLTAMRTRSPGSL